MFVPCGEYMPDQPDYNNPGAGNVRNVIPVTTTSYAPLAGLSVFSANALDARCQGAYATADSSGNVYAFMGTANKLWQINNSGSFVDISNPTPYTLDAKGKWNFCLFNDRVIASNFTDPIQGMLFGIATKFSNLSTGAPKARYIAVIKNWLVTANTSDPTWGVQPQRVWWSGLGDPTNFPAPGSTLAVQNQSDYQDLFGDHGWVQGIVGNLGSAHGAVFCERAIWRMNYQGYPAIFSFEPAQGARGTPAPGSIVQLGSIVYYLGEDGFYMFDGSTATPIGTGKVDKTFYADFDISYSDRVSAAVDPVNKLVFWAYPGAGHSGGNPNHLMIYNWALNRWAIADVTCELIFRSQTFGFTLDGLDVFGYTMDTLPFSLDSRQWTNGKIIMSAIDINHKLDYFNGANLAPTVDTSESELYPSLNFPYGQQPIIKDYRAMITNAKPIVDGGVPSIQVGTRSRLIDSITWSNAVAINALGDCPVRATGRYVRGRITLPAGSTFTHIQGLDVSAIPSGLR